MIRAPAWRGQPLALLGAVVGAWCALRLATFAPLSPLPLAPLPLAAASPALSAGPGMAAVAKDQRETYPPGGSAQPMPGPAIGLPVEAPLIEPLPASPSGASVESIQPRHGIAGHNLLMLTGLPNIGPPYAVLGYLRSDTQGQVQPAVTPYAVPPASPVGVARRWAIDSWVLVRGGRTAIPAAAQPSYGRSQAGAVLRYRLVPAGSLRPEAYLRASAGLAGPVERQVAAGLSARPFARVPIRLAAELRAGEGRGSDEVRPAAFAVTELAPLRLAPGMSAEAYGQAGWVGGEGATAFADGQARLTARMARQGDSEFTAGAGAWAGAQEGAARLDLGPTAQVTFRLGEGRARIAVDYRLRVAGDAEPGSGAALTLSAGF